MEATDTVTMELVKSAQIIDYLNRLADPDRASHAQRYFKTGEGEYGHGDRFLGIRVPALRRAVKQFHHTSLSEIRRLLKSEYHEARLLAVLLLVDQFSRADDGRRERIFNLYLKHTRYINNWDLVDSSAPAIVGAWLMDRDRSVLYQLAQSPDLWERRIAILSTAWFIKNGRFGDTLRLAVVLLDDPEDLIHKDFGWMLREVGKRDRRAEERFLQRYYKKMPRTILRYAIERFSTDRRQAYLIGML